MHGDYNSIPRVRPNCYDTDPPCTMPLTSRPSCRSMTGRHGTSVNSWLCSTTANLPLDSWSQEELAYRASIDRTYISSLERSVYNASIDVVDRLAAVLEVEASDLLKRPAEKK